MKNDDELIIKAFGEEWARFNQANMTEEERAEIFRDYFDIFPKKFLTKEARGIDVGCGSGRWAMAVAPKIQQLVCVDASSEALDVAATNLSQHPNVTLTVGNALNLPFDELSFDFAYSLGVLHHLADTNKALLEINRVLKPGAPFLLYLYYAFDNRPLWYRWIWKFSELGRFLICRLPSRLRFVCSDVVAIFVYLPLSRIARMMAYLGVSVEAFPLSYYRDKSFLVMRTDALDRLGTRLEKRFTKAEIQYLLEQSGFSDIEFSSGPPFWCAISRKVRDQGENG